MRDLAHAPFYKHLEPGAVIALQYDRVAVEEEIEREQPASGVEPLAEQRIAREGKHEDEDVDMARLGLAHLMVQLAQRGKRPIVGKPQSRVEPGQRLTQHQTFEPPNPYTLVHPPTTFECVDAVVA